jgi:hypothetical protein
MPSRLPWPHVPGQTGRLPKSSSAAPKIRRRPVVHSEQAAESTRFGTALFSTRAAKLCSFRVADKPAVISPSLRLPSSVLGSTRSGQEPSFVD